ncbi:MAG: peptidoglycan editing factor PgeF [Phototrophicaceae bacterium]|nr:Polyphenol oxidase [Anaerolineae bacterium]MBW7880766.1 peptidoglycan editing factor PgeF [Anaerolineae bacterium]
MQRIDGPVPYYTFDGFAGTTHAIFTRHGGVSPEPFGSLNTGGFIGDSQDNVRRNHEIMAEAVNVDPQRMTTTWQVHGSETVRVLRPSRDRRWIAQADGMVTDRHDVVLTMRFADCTPILAVDTVRGVIGIAHAGWRGTVRGAAASLIRAMTRAYGTNPADVQAGVGPAIGPRKFQVGEEVVRAALAYYGDLDGLMRRDPADGTAYFDLWEANRRDLASAGVERIEVMGVCTAERTDDFFSHRAEQGKTGRFGALICLS